METADFTNPRVLTIILVIVDSKPAFELVYAPQVKEHLKAIERKHYDLNRQEIEGTRTRLNLTRLAMGLQSRCCWA